MEFAAASSTEETTQTTSNEPVHEEDQQVRQSSDTLTSSLSSIKQILDGLVAKASQLSKLSKIVYGTVFFIVAIFTLIYNLIHKNNQIIIKEYEANETD